MSVHDTQADEARPAAIEAAVAAVRDGKLIVLPTDTVYGIGADAFTPDAVQALLDAKGRGRDMPPPVLIGDPAVLLALAVDLPDYVEDLTDAFWPGPLTLLLQAQPSLTWDLGETRGTVALRMPDDEVALELLRATGPLAVSSANRSGKPAALSVLDAATQLGDSVEIYLDGGPARLGEASTIIDTTVEPPEIVRQGALSQEEIVAAVGDIFAAPEPPAEEADETADAEDADGAADGNDAADAEGTADAADADGTQDPADADSTAETAEADGTQDPAEDAADAGAEDAAADARAEAAAPVPSAEGALAAPAFDEPTDAGTTPSLPSEDDVEVPGVPTADAAPSLPTEADDAPAALALPSEDDVPAALSLPAEGDEDGAEDAPAAGGTTAG